MLFSADTVMELWKSLPQGAVEDKTVSERQKVGWSPGVQGSCQAQRSGTQVRLGTFRKRWQPVGGLAVRNQLLSTCPGSGALGCESLAGHCQDQGPVRVFSQQDKSSLLILHYVL